MGYIDKKENIEKEWGNEGDVLTSDTIEVEDVLDSVISECVDHAVDRVGDISDSSNEACNCFIYSALTGCHWGRQCPLYGTNKCEQSSLINNILKRGV